MANALQNFGTGIQNKLNDLGTKSGSDETFGRNPDYTPEKGSEKISREEPETLNYALPTKDAKWFIAIMDNDTDRPNFEDANTISKKELSGEARDAATATKEALEVARSHNLDTDYKVDTNVLKIDTVTFYDKDHKAVATAQKKVTWMLERDAVTNERNVSKFVKFDAKTPRTAKEYKQATEGVLKELYGAQASKEVDDWSERAIKSTSAVAQSAIEILNSIKEGPAPVTPLGGVSNEKDVQRALSDTFKSLLVQYPERAKELMALMGQDIAQDIFAAGSGLGQLVKDTFQQRLLVGLLDKVDTDTRSDNVLSLKAKHGGTTHKLNNVATVTHNRSQIIAALTSTTAARKTVSFQRLTNAAPSAQTAVALAAPATLTNLAFGGKADGAPAGSVGVDKIKNLAQGKKVFDVAAKFTTRADSTHTNSVNFSRYSPPNNVLLKGLDLPVSANTNAAGHELTEALAKAGSQDITLLEDIAQLGYEDFIKNTAGLNEQQKLSKLKSLRDRINTSGSVDSSVKEAIERAIVSNEIGSSPDKKAEFVSGQMLKDALLALDTAFAAAGGTSPELNKLNDKASREYLSLQEAINNVINGKGVTPELIERMSGIMMGVKHEASRKVMADALRGVALLQAAKGLAVDVAKSDHGLKYDYTYFALIERVLDGKDNTVGAPAAGILSADAAAKYLRDVIFGGKAGDKTTIQLLNAGQQSLLAAKYGITPPATIPTNIEIPNQVLAGNAASEFHKYMGIVRRGQEGAVLNALRGNEATHADYLETAFGIKKTDKNATEALARLRLILADSSTDFDTLPAIIAAAANGLPASTGERYSNLVRVFERYIRHGGDVKEMLKTAERQAGIDFIDAIQEQANTRTGAEQGAMQTAAETTLSIEEQRLQFLTEYEDLSSTSGWRRAWGSIKKAGSMLKKQFMSMSLPAIAMGGAKLLAVAGGAAFAPWILPAATIGYGIYRVVGTLKGGRALFEAGRKLEGHENGWGKIGSALLGGAVGAASMALFPTPVGMIVTALAESIGIDLIQARSLSESHKVLLDAHTKYETAMKAKLNGLDVANATDKDLLERMAATMGVPIADRNAIDKDAVVAAILANRQKAQDGDADMRLKLSQFSRIMEQTIAADATKINEANVNAQKIVKTTLERVTAYSVGSGMTKLVVGSMGTMGMLGAGFGFENGVESGAEGLENKLDGQLDAKMEALGYGKDADVVGITELEDGKVYAMVDFTGNGDQKVDALVEVSEADMADGNLTFSGQSGLNFSNVHMSNTTVSDDGALATTTIQQQYSLENDIPASDVSVHDSATDTEYQGYVVTKSGEIDVLYQEDDGSVGVYSAGALESKYSATYTTETGESIELVPHLVPTEDNELVVAMVYEKDGQTQIAGLIDPRTGESIESVTAVDGQTLEALGAGVRMPDSDGETVAGGFVYEAVSGDSAERVMDNLLREVYPDISREDMNKVWAEAQGNGQNSELRSFLQQHPEQNSIAEDNPAFANARSQMSSYQVGDRFVPDILARMAPAAVAEMNAKYDGADVDLAFKDSSFADIYDQNMDGFEDGKGNSGEAEPGTFRITENPLDGAKAESGFPAPKEGHTLWFDQTDDAPRIESEGGMWTGLSTWWSSTTTNVSNWFANLGGGDDTTTTSTSTTTTSDDSTTTTTTTDDDTVTQTNTNNSGTTGTGRVTTVQFDQSGNEMAGGQGGATTTTTETSTTTTTTGTQPFRVTLPTWGGSEPADGSVEYLPLNPTLRDQIAEVTYQDPLFPNSEPKPITGEIIGFIPGTGNDIDEGVIYRDAQGQEVILRGNVEIQYKDGKIEDVPTIAALENRDPMARDYGSPIGRFASNAQQAWDGLTNNVGNLFGRQGPVWDLPGEMGDQAIAPDFLKFELQKPDGTTATYVRGQVLTVSLEGITVNNPMTNASQFIPGSVVGISETDTNGDNIADDIKRIRFDDIVNQYRQEAVAEPGIIENATQAWNELYQRWENSNSGNTGGSSKPEVPEPAPLNPGRNPGRE